MHYILCKDTNWIKALKEEVSDNYTKEITTESGLALMKIPSEVNLAGGFLAFSTTTLINATELPEESISNQAKKVVELIAKKIPEGEKINCHVYSITHKYGILETGRAELLKEKVVKNLRKEKVFCLRKGFDRSLSFIQVLVLADRSIALSVLSVAEVKTYHSLISPYIGGFNNVEDDKKAPSRAFKKIVEAQEIMGRSITDGEVLIDLGACPGGWTYVARKRGAKVIAIDRSELREDLMADSKVVFLKTDAFKYVAEEEIDWAVSDIISTPDRVLELVENWVIGNNCKHFIFTIKFQGDENYKILSEFKKIEKKSEFKVILKQLNANKNEVTVMGSRKDI
ncbi:hypothetical protein A9Q84_00635 [Halobacteriovorax marinus]|uniref:Ribosomal RNA methyltransferase FtsJ domain-containing protein n=1 Tax=Halobacteriovorax marinus TaxID=97084 RepID=A0A1Y5FBV8_9BACT|nr:hypothetical protein A9Q84_00635 [Halobacteriovorax marinus]